MSAAAVFLMMNGWELRFVDLQAHQWLIGLYGRGEVTKTANEQWLRGHAEPLL